MRCKLSTTSPFTAFAVLFTLWASPARAEEILVILRSAAEVKGAEVNLHEVAAVTHGSGKVPEALEKMSLLASPKINEALTLRKEKVRALLNRRGFNKDQVKLVGADEVYITTSSVWITKEELHRLGREFVDRQTQALEGERTITYTRPAKDIRVPCGDLLTSFRIQWRGQPRFKGRVSLDIHVLADNEVFTTITLPMVIRTFHKVLRASGEILPQTPFIPSNTYLTRTEITYLPQQPALSLAQMSDRLAKTKIPADSVIFLEDGYLPPVVKKGKEVRVLVRRGSLEIVSSGIARENGCLGDMVEVMNPLSKRTFKAEVNGFNQVIVTFQRGKGRCECNKGKGPENAPPP